MADGFAAAMAGPAAVMLVECQQRATPLPLHTG